MTFQLPEHTQVVEAHTAWQSSLTDVTCICLSQKDCIKIRPNARVVINTQRRNKLDESGCSVYEVCH